MKIAIIIISIIHGLIHLLGFLKAFKLAEIYQLKQPISTLAGGFWLLASVLFLAFALITYLEKSITGYLGLVAIILSQILIFTVWQDAKFGSLANLFLLLVSIQMIFYAIWEQKLTREKSDFINKMEAVELRKVQEAPAIIQKWLNRIGFDENHSMISAEIHQLAQMKMKPDQEDWKKATAYQISRINSPAFHWEVKMEMMPGLTIYGRDQFLEGKGEMLIRLGAILSIVDEKGSKIDKGSLQRLLGELVWIPSLALHPQVSWKELDDHSLEGSLKVGKTTGKGIFYFNEDGDFTKFEALRYYENKPESNRFPWILTVKEYRDWDGIRIPNHMEATWILPDGDWTWLDLKITSLKYSY
ncbi:MAG: hypothetical protein HWE15_08580 [Algoriphagus sp.]|uniref:DUF6544 family protein n=1 Tax=Algoriphagus sp. TaxID=1872435 RepID=UPI0017A4DBF7|nr:DUF6544 family protein [Algoriphagus sp.]NVJ86346.1 hypothetical protein [Algoriphagus sp.]